MYTGGRRITVSMYSTWVQDNNELVQHMERVCGHRVTTRGSVVSCSGAFQGSSHKNYSDLSKECYPKCVRTMDRAFAEGKDGPLPSRLWAWDVTTRMTYPVRNIQSDHLVWSL